MSEGPIKRERDSWKPLEVSTRDSARVCAQGSFAGRGYCGRRASKLAVDWSVVTCADCHAAQRADAESRS